jgi:hypothetical protein
MNNLEADGAISLISKFRKKLCRTRFLWTKKMIMAIPGDWYVKHVQKSACLAALSYNRTFPCEYRDVMQHKSNTPLLWSDFHPALSSVWRQPHLQASSTQPAGQRIAQNVLPAYRQALHFLTRFQTREYRQMNDYTHTHTPLSSLVRPSNWRVSLTCYQGVKNEDW